MKPVTLLGLTVLRLLDAQPQHPYELRQQMREQGIDQLVKVTHGALYYTVETLTKNGLIQPTETGRQGNRPERTVYAITEAGRDRARDRLRALLSTTAAEYPSYCAALAFLALIPMGEALKHLELRSVMLEGELSASQTQYEALRKRGTPPIAIVEMLYIQAHLRADLDLTRAICSDIRSERLVWKSMGDDERGGEDESAET